MLKDLSRVFTVGNMSAVRFLTRWVGIFYSNQSSTDQLEMITVGLGIQNSFNEAEPAVGN